MKNRSGPKEQPEILDTIDELYQLKKEITESQEKEPITGKKLGDLLDGV